MPKKKMRATKSLVTNPTAPFVRKPSTTPFVKWDPQFQLHSAKFPVHHKISSRFRASCSAQHSPQAVTSYYSSGLLRVSREKVDKIEERIEKVIPLFIYFKISVIFC